MRRCKSKSPGLFIFPLYYSRARASLSWHGLGYYFKEKESANMVAGGSWGFCLGRRLKETYPQSCAAARLKVKPTQPPYPRPVGAALLGVGTLVPPPGSPRGSAPHPCGALVPEHSEGAFPKLILGSC